MYLLNAVKHKYSLLNPYPFDSKTVKKRMIDLDVTVNSIAQRTGIPQPTVSRYVNGSGRNPKIQDAIAKVLKMPLSAILRQPEPDRESQQSAA